MQTLKTPVTLMLTFGLWLGLVLGCSSLRKAAEEKRAEREGPPITIFAEDLYKAYESSEADADKLYQGKILIVTGGTVFIVTGDHRPRMRVNLVPCHHWLTIHLDTD